MRILIVDDNPADRELLVFNLQEHFKTEAKFREVQSLQAAHEYLARGSTDAVILDLQLPDSTGLDTFLRVHNAYPGVPVVIVSNTQNLELAKQMIRLGAEDYIPKGYLDTTMLFQRVVFAVERTRRNQELLMSDPPPDKKDTVAPPAMPEEASPNTLRSGSGNRA